MPSSQPTPSNTQQSGETIFQLMQKLQKQVKSTESAPKTDFSHLNLSPKVEKVISQLFPQNSSVFRSPQFDPIDYINSLLPDGIR